MTSFFSILEEAASEIREKPLFVFPETRWGREETLTYGELASRAAAAAQALSELANPGERALLLFPTGPAFWEAFLGCLAAGVIAVPLKLPNLNRTDEQLRRICNDCIPSVLATDEATADLLERRAEKHPYLRRLRVIAPGHWRGGGSVFRGKAPGREAVAVLQYTSGSTSQPKGVQISHANLLANAEMIRDRMEIRFSADSSVTWLPHYHDMGLVGSYLETLFTRNTTWCLPPEEFALRPERWLELISRTRASICGGPDFAYRTCVERIGEEDVQGLDLSSWRVAYIGAERIRPESLQHFAERFSPHGFRESAFFPCYGLAEATLLAAGGPAHRGPIIRRISSSALRTNRIASPASETDSIEICGSGQIFEGCKVVILDPDTGSPVADAQVGEVCVSGPAVTRGYFGREDLNEQQFRHVTVDAGCERFLRTGDLGFLSGGELFVTGRMKEMMIVRGRNLYPEDVEEQACQAHEALAPGAAVAFSVELDGQESLVVAAEVRRSELRMKSPEAIVASVRHAIAQMFGVSPAEILLLRPGAIPRTTSGKHRRFAVRESYATAAMQCLFREKQ